MAMIHPQVVFDKPQKDLQARHLCFLAKNIAGGDFARGGFWVLPYCAQGNPNTVYFPDLGYSGQFWKEISKSPNIDLCKPFPKLAIAEASNLIQSIMHTENTLRQQWLGIEEKFFSYCLDFLILDDTLQELEAIEIMQSQYGTAGSYDFKKGKSGQILYIIIRSDMGLSKLIQVLLMAFWTKQTRQRAEIQEYKWLNKMATVEFLIRNTVFSTLAKDENCNAIGNIKNISHDSKKYLDELGFPAISELHSGPRGITGRSGEVLGHFFTDQESELLKYFIAKKDEIVDFDVIAGVLWKEAADDKFSLYAIAKVIENIRKKLHNLGINREIIHTVRKRGYLFTN